MKRHGDHQSFDRRSHPAERRRSRRRISARSRQRPQSLSRRARARRRVVPPQARPCPRADGRERRRQVDADEDHRRHLHARLRLVQAEGPGNQADLAARRAALRHRHDPSGAQPDEFHDGRREHLDPARALERARPRAPRRDAQAHQGAVRTARHRHRSGNRGARPLRRQSPDGRNRQGCRLTTPTF